MERTKQVPPSLETKGQGGGSSSVVKPENARACTNPASPEAHYWLIDSPDGPTSQGTCRHCGEKREFRNSTGGTDWNREP